MTTAKKLITDPDKNPLGSVTILSWYQSRRYRGERFRDLHSRVAEKFSKLKLSGTDPYRYLYFMNSPLHNGKQTNTII